MIQLYPYAESNMSKLRKLEQESKELNALFDKALLSSSKEEKQNALIQFQSSKLMQNETKLRNFIDPIHPVVALIVLATKTLPAKIESLKSKAALIQIQLNAENDEVLENDSLSNSESVIDVSSVEETIVSNIGAREEITPETTPVQETNPKLLALEKVKEALKPYVDTTKARTSEYYYGMVGTFFSYVGMSGYSKTTKLDTLDKFFANLKTDNAPELDAQDIKILTTGYLGNALNPLLEDEIVGHQLKELLKIESLTNSL